MTDQPTDLDALIEFPTTFVFRVMGEASADFADRCNRAVQRALSRPPEAVEVKPSSRGTYQSVRLGVTVVSSDEVRAVYAELHALEGVRLLL
jgi:uncharacterized protein